MSEKRWTEMSAEEKLAFRVGRWRDPGVQFASSEAEAEYKARVDRVTTAAQLGQPDRVPVRLAVGFWPAKAAGMTSYEAMNDPQRASVAWREFNLKFQPDVMVDPLNSTVPGAMFEALDYRLYSWPGHGVAENAGYQYNEKEWMLAEEYEHLIADPTDYLLRTYLPRTVGAFEGFSGLSPFFDYVELPFVGSQVAGWGGEAMASGLRRLADAADARAAWAKVMMPAMDEIKGLGFPAYVGCASKAPFDILGDTLRGTKGVVVDMFRCPDKVLAACERLTKIAIDWPVRRGRAPGSPFCFMPLHKGSDGFMSDEQFRTFYWPSLRQTLLGLIDQGIIPFLFAEGRYNSRLEVIMDLPKGKTVWMFDQTDMERAKATIGQVACIQGNMPISLIHMGTTEEIAHRTRHLIDVAGKGGGFILDLGAIADGGKDENLEMMVRVAREYGVY